MSSQRFNTALQTVLQGNHIRTGIGTLGEKTVHAVLKNYFEPHAYGQEIKLGNFTADIVGENGVIEIQTAGFQNLRKKLAALLDICDVTVVYPLPYNKWLINIDVETGDIKSKRKSPKKGNVYEAFSELYKIKEYIKSENFRFCIIMLNIEEYRIPPIPGKRNRKGYSLYDRVPVSLHKELHIKCMDDWRCFIPDGLNGEFTSADFAKIASIPVYTAQTALNVLTDVNAVLRIGKKGRSILYNINAPT